MVEGLTLGGISFASLVFSWQHLPEKIKQLSLRYPLVTDVAGGFLVFTLLTGFSSSLTAVIGAVSAGLAINLLFVVLRFLGKLPEHV